MQFIPNGPDIPEELLQRHEEGRVLFFCGAGISCPAGLPLFGALIQRLSAAFGEPLDALEEELLQKGHLDQVLGRFEQRVQGRRAGVRQHLPPLLTPDLTRPAALTTHRALLELGRNRSGELRLVTTNFDRLFEEADKARGRDSEARASHTGPKAIKTRPFPPSDITVHPDPPVRSRWTGVVHLHGRLSEHPSSDDLGRLVIADSDFGRAYLTEGWAARFVVGLLRDFTLCFVGYSIDDPVMRYVTAAHALDGAGAIFAFAPCAANASEKKVNEQWQVKYVTPILYDDQDRHRLLHRTLHVWASLYSDGIRGKQRLVARYALRAPDESNGKNDFVGRLLWALADPSGKPAQRFARHNPCPPLEWLEPFSKRRFGHSDLRRFGVSPQEQPLRRLRFSLIDRPAPHHRSAQMHLVAFDPHRGDWDDVMGWLAEWLLRHLDDPRLVLWIAKSGGHVHPRWLGRLEDKLRDLASLELNGKVAKLEALRQQAPNAIPGPSMRTLWRLVCSGRLYAQGAGDELARWLNQLERERLTTTLRLKFRDLLCPRVRLGQPMIWGHSGLTDQPTTLGQLVSWQVALASDDVHTSLLSCDDKHWKDALPLLLVDIQQLLLDALALRNELRLNDSQSAPSWCFLQSIHSSLPNSSEQNWVNLILLLKESWLAIHVHDGPQARRIAQGWFDRPESTFKRLALFAASQKGCLPPEQWVEWLLAEDARWLWRGATEQELHKLLEFRGSELTGSAKERLEAVILAGPSHAAHGENAVTQNEVDRWIWERLANLHTSGLMLGEAAKARWLELNSRFQPGPRPLAAIVAPRKRQELAVWLLFSGASHLWVDACAKHPLNSLFALTDLAFQGNWQTLHWRTALSYWCDQKVMFIQRLWRYAAPFLQVQAMPDGVLQEMASEISLWLKAVSEQIQAHEKILLALCRRLLALPLKTQTGILENGEPLDCAVTNALNHPVGRVTRALINLWLHRRPKDNDQLPADLQPLFTRICDESVDRFRHGRILLGTQIIKFFCVDRAWTESKLLPLLSWANPAEARAVWQGFLYSPPRDATLLVAIKADLLNTAKHYEELGPDRKRFAAFLTDVALDQPEGYIMEEFRSAFATLPPQGLEAAAQTLRQTLEGAGDQREEFWENRFKPFWEIWPKSAKQITPQIAKSFALLVVAADCKFPDAVALLQSWLQGSDDPQVVVQKLNNTNLCSSFPKDALTFLHCAVDQSRPWRPWQPSLRQCLETIQRAEPRLADDHRFRELRDYGPVEH